MTRYTWRRPSRVLCLSKLKMACRRRSRWLYSPRYRLDKTGARIGDESDGHRANAPIQLNGLRDAHARLAQYPHSEDRFPIARVQTLALQAPIVHGVDKQDWRQYSVGGPTEY